MYEVELKFAVPDPAAVTARLAAWGAVEQAPQSQLDRYFNHPCRDFAESHEALRVRSIGSRNVITYKGPVVDTQTKMRREIEPEFASGPAAVAELVEMLTLLGFRPVRDVCKVRTPYAYEREGRAFEIAVDRVEGLGSFVEIETLANEASRDAARDAVLAVARELGLSQPERRSYLKMLLEPPPPAT